MIAFIQFLERFRILLFIFDKQDDASSVHEDILIGV